MKVARGRADTMQLRLLGAAVALILSCNAIYGHTSKPAIQPLVLSVQMEKGKLIYKLDGKQVEDSVQNSLLTNLGRIVRARGTNFSVWIIIDVRAPFSEVGKLETALDMSGLTRRRIFVTDFADQFMNEIHWDERAVPLPRVVPR